MDVLAGIPGAVAGLEMADRRWEMLRSGTEMVSHRVVVAEQLLHADDLWDVVICGGTLGILLGAVLVERGLQVVLLERGVLAGRAQEWNVSRKELEVLIRLGIMTEPELEAVISSAFNPVRVGFCGGEDLYVEDVLNLGVSPAELLAHLKEKFLAQGGLLREGFEVETVTIHPDGVCVNGEVQGRLLLDGMGHFSPLAQQARGGKRPDGVCLVVGTCGEGFPENKSGDLIYSFTPITNQCQYFWEAFPAKDGRTTYLFTYVDADPGRMSLRELFDEYFRLLPEYQGVKLEDIQFKRALYGFFPCYKDSPLVMPWDRIMAVGDSSGLQSPLSFGGFGAMLRHLDRLTEGICGALEADCLTRQDLAELQAYQPNLSVTWLFQKTMSVGMGQKLPAPQINWLLAEVFAAMAGLGDGVLRPFLQDVVQFGALSKTLWAATLRQPMIALRVLPQVGVMALLEWMGHFLRLSLYSLLHRFSNPMAFLGKRTGRNGFLWRCRLRAWQYGSGNDYGAEKP